MKRGKKLQLGVLIIVGVPGLLLICSGFYIPIKGLIAQQLLHAAWHQSRTTGEIVKPWPWADTWPVGRLLSESYDLDLIILQGASGESLAFGPAHLFGSSMPGTVGHCILAGHRDTSFKFLKSLQVGDELVLQGLTDNQKYRVVSHEIIRADALYLDREKDNTLTLLTCFPFDAILPNPSHRYAVTAKRVTTGF